LILPVAGSLIPVISVPEGSKGDSISKSSRFLTFAKVDFSYSLQVVFPQLVSGSSELPKCAHKLPCGERGIGTSQQQSIQGRSKNGDALGKFRKQGIVKLDEWTSVN